MKSELNELVPNIIMFLMVAIVGLLCGMSLQMLWNTVQSRKTSDIGFKEYSVTTNADEMVSSY